MGDFELVIHIPPFHFRMKSAMRVASRRAYAKRESNAAREPGGRPTPKTDSGCSPRDCLRIVFVDWDTVLTVAASRRQSRKASSCLANWLNIKTLSLDRIFSIDTIQSCSSCQSCLLLYSRNFRFTVTDGPKLINSPSSIRVAAR